MTRVGGYARISADDEGNAAGVTRQQEDIRTLAKARGWTVADMYVDNNISAYKNVVRPAFERLLEDLQSGQIDGVAIYNLDRLARRPKDLERLLDLYDHRPLVFGTCEADIDLSTPDGRFMARLLINFASKSSADTARRVARAKLQSAQRGVVHGGGRRPYGYKSDRVTIEPKEAAVIREAARRCLLGESLVSICADFDRRGLPTPNTSAAWHRSTLRKMLINPRMAGLRAYRGALMMSDSGEPVQAIWEPILDRDTWEQLTVYLTDRSRDSNVRHDRKYLLSGFLRCHCGTKMTGAFADKQPEYRCTLANKGCGRTKRKAAPIDAHVTELVLQYLERLEIETVENVSTESVLDRDIAEAEKSLSALIDEWNAGRISDSVFFTAQARKEASLNALKSQRATQKRRQTMRAPVGANVREAWAEGNVSQRRAILQEVLWQIDVLPKPRTAPKTFDAAYYVVRFR